MPRDKKQRELTSRSARPPRVHSAGGGVAFVPTPFIRGMYMKTDMSVSVRCPECEESAGWPCWFKNGFRGATHWVRRKAYSKMLLEAAVEAMEAAEGLQKK